MMLHLNRSALSSAQKRGASSLYYLHKYLKQGCNSFPTCDRYQDSSDRSEIGKPLDAGAPQTMTSTHLDIVHGLRVGEFDLVDDHRNGIMRTFSPIDATSLIPAHQGQPEFCAPGSLSIEPRETSIPPAPSAS